MNEINKEINNDDMFCEDEYLDVQVEMFHKVPPESFVSIEKHDHTKEGKARRENSIKE